MFPFVCSSRLDLKSSGFQDTKIPEKIDSDEKAGHYLGADATTCLQPSYCPTDVPFRTLGALAGTVKKTMLGKDSDVQTASMTEGDIECSVD